MKPNPAALQRHSTVPSKPLGLTAKPTFERKLSNVDAMKAQLAVRLAGMSGTGKKKSAASRRSRVDSSDDNASSSDSGSD